MAKAKITINGGEISIEGSGELTREDIKDYNVSEIEKIVIEDDCTKIGDYVFSNAYTSSSLTSLTISNSVLAIGRDAFSHSYNLTNIDIPNVKNIGDYAFDFCGELTTVTIGGAIESIGSRCFLGCKKLSSVTINASTPPALIRDDATHLSLVFEETALGENSIHVPSGAGNIYYNNSYWAEYKDFITDDTEVVHVTSVALDKSTMTMAVGEISGLTATVSPDDATDKSVSWSSEDDNIATVDSNGKVTAIATGNCKITVTANDKTFGTFTATCTVTVTDSPTPIVHVTSVALDKSTMTMAVGEISGLTATVLPNNATDKVVTWSSSNNSIATVTTSGVVTAIANGVANITVTSHDGDYTDSCEVTVEGGLVVYTATYENGSEVKAYKCSPDDQDQGLCDCRNAYYVCGNKLSTATTNINEGRTNITSVTFGVSTYPILTVDDGCFSNFTKLKTLIAYNLESASSSMCNNCGSLETFHIYESNGFKKIDGNAFAFCNSLTSVTYERSCILETISNSAFYECSNLQKIAYSDDEWSFRYLKNLKEINNDAFFKTSIQKIGLGMDGSLSDFTRIGKRAFSTCNSLTEIQIQGGTNITIDEYAFEKCAELTSVTIGNGVTNIGPFAFENCSRLTSVTIGNGVTNIDNYAFENCSMLTNATIEAIDPPTLGLAVFNNTNSCPIYVPSGSVGAYKTATNWSSYADRIQPIQTS